MDLGDFGRTAFREFAVEAGKAYYLLLKRWSEDAGYSYTMVGSVVVPQKTATAQHLRGSGRRRERCAAAGIRQTELCQGTLA